MENKENEIPGFHENERASRLASSAFQILRNLNRESQMHVFNALHVLFADRREITATRAAATSAINRWLADDHAARADAEKQTTRAYEAWRRAQEHVTVWPSNATIRRAYGGSWTNALAAATGAPEPIFRSDRRESRGKTYSDADLIRILQEWAAETPGKLRLSGYEAWAHRARKSGRRVPLNAGTMTQRFGSRKAACEAAGIWGERCMNFKDRIPTYPRESLLDSLELAHKSMGGRMTIDKYSAFRELKMAAGIAMPSGSLIQQRIGDGSWLTAIAIFAAERGDPRYERDDDDPDTAGARVLAGGPKR